jgi:hypothetical protein
VSCPLGAVHATPLCRDKPRVAFVDGASFRMRRMLLSIQKWRLRTGSRMRFAFCPAPFHRDRRSTAWLCPASSCAISSFTLAATISLAVCGCCGYCGLSGVFDSAAIGVLLCASKNDEVVEYALSRTLSPPLIAEYQTKLPARSLAAFLLRLPDQAHPNAP